MVYRNSLGLASPGGEVPASHVLTKIVGDPFTLQWTVFNGSNQSRVVRLVTYETRPAGLFLTGGTAWLTLPPGVQLGLDASGLTSTLWTQSQALRAVCRLEGAASLAEAVAGRIVVVAEHIFSLLVGPGPLPMARIRGAK